MDILGSFIDSAKQKASSAIRDRIDQVSSTSGNALLNLLRDAFIELPESRRQELMAAFASSYETYKKQPAFDFETIWKEFSAHPVIQDVAVSVSKKLVSGFLKTQKPG